MSEKSGLTYTLAGNIHHRHIVSIDIDSLVTDNQLFVILSLFSVSMSEHKDVGISNIQLVLPFC